MSAPSATATGHLLTIADLTPDQLEEWLALAVRFKRDRARFAEALRGHTVLMHFTKPSTRTRVSFEAAVAALGGAAVFAGRDELQLGRGEPIKDTARVISRYCAAFVIRTFEQSDVEEFARWSDVPVVNALTDRHHPCQALADLLTLEERFGKLAGLEVAYVGDGNNVAHSLIQGCALAGAHIRVAAPPGREPDAAVVQGAERLARRSGGSVAVMRAPRAAVTGAHCVYTDVFVSMGQEGEREQKLAELAAYRVTPDLMALARPDAVFMHCLPAHRGEEVDDAVIEGPRSVVFDQAENRMHTEAAVLLALTRSAG